MLQKVSHWLAGSLNAEVQKTKDSRRLNFSAFLSFSNAVVTVWLLDRNQQKIEDDNGQQVTLSAKELSLSGPTAIPLGRQNQRLRQLFGRHRLFWSYSFSFDVSRQLWGQCRYIVVKIVPGDVTDGSTVREGQRSRESECICLEMSRKKLNAAWTPVSFLLISKGEASRRMERLMRKQHVLHRRSQAVDVVLSNLMVKMHRGGDTPLLTEKI